MARRVPQYPPARAHGGECRDRAVERAAARAEPASNEEADHLIFKRSKRSARNYRSRRVQPAKDRRPKRVRDDLAAPVEGNADMASLTQRSILRTSIAL